VPDYQPTTKFKAFASAAVLTTGGNMAVTLYRQVDAFDGIDFTAGAAFPQDSTNLKAERGPSTFDTKHRFTAALNYALPSWHAAGKFGSGWQLNWIATLQSGRPIPIITSDDTSGRFYFNQRPKCSCGNQPDPRELESGDWLPQSRSLCTT
jgi:hypothetical protein